MSFLKQFKKITDLANKDICNLVYLDAFQEKLSEEIFQVLNNVFETQRLRPDNSKLTKEDVQKIIEDYTQLNQAIAVASSFAPGPLGIMAAAPEMILTISNQMKMIYDLGCCFGKEHFLNKDLLIDVPLQAAGVFTNLSEIQASTTNN